MISQMENNNKEGNQMVRHSDFSIDHILNRAGKSVQNKSFSWLQCTRYCPPKIPRIQKRDGPQKRQLGRHPRIPFTSTQLSILEEKFKTSPYLSSEEVTTLSKTLDLADIRVKIWFQNRRARERREKSATETSPVKPENLTVKTEATTSCFTQNNSPGPAEEQNLLSPSRTSASPGRINFSTSPIASTSSFNHLMLPPDGATFNILPINSSLSNGLHNIPGQFPVFLRFPTNFVTSSFSDEDSR